MTPGSLQGPPGNKLALSFRATVKAIRPDFSDARIAANVGESRQNFAKAMIGPISTDRVISWILRWNEAHPGFKVKLVVKNLVDLELSKAEAKL